MEGFFRKGVNVSRFFAYIRNGRKTGSKLFSKKVRFSLIVCRKNLNKGDEGLRRDHRWMTVSRTSPDGRKRQIFEIFSENRGQFAILPGSNPDREFVCESGKISFFLRKDAFFTDRLPKNFEYKVWRSSSRGTRGPGLFSVFFSEKCGFLLSVCRKNLNKGGDGFLRGRQGISVPCCDCRDG